MKYEEGVKLLDKVQQNKRSRLISWDNVKFAINKLYVDDLPFIGIDGGSLVETEYPFTTTLVLISRIHNRLHQPNETTHNIIFGAQRCEGLNTGNNSVFNIYEEHELNRGRWKLLTGFNIYKWSSYLDDTKVYL